MYLSRLTLNPRNADARRDLSSPYDMHCTLMRAFADEGPDDNRMLFRVEPSRPKENGRVVLVQSSSIRPDFSFLGEPPFMEEEPYLLRLDEPKRVDPDFEAGQHLAFRLLGNPTKKSDGKRIALTDEEDYYNWLSRKANQAGFDVLFAHPTPYWINGDAGSQDTYSKREIPHFAVRYDGLLRVEQPDHLEETLAGGIGPAKAFGFGLLTLAPPR